MSEPTVTRTLYRVVKSIPCQLSHKQPWCDPPFHWDPISRDYRALHNVEERLAEFRQLYPMMTFALVKVETVETILP